MLRFFLPCACFPDASVAGSCVELLGPLQQVDAGLWPVAAGNAISPAGEPRLTAAGLGAELRSRPGREAWAWIARSDVVGQPRAESAGAVILVRAAGPAGQRWSIGALAVHPMYRRRGVGTMLLTAAMRFAGAHGAVGLHAETLAGWPAAAAFWQAARLAAETGLTKIPGSGESRKTAEGRTLRQKY